MFTWICPQCGREVPPSYTDCPDCAGKAQPPAEAPAQQVPPPQDVQRSAPPVIETRPPAAPPPPPRQVPAARTTLPTWLMTIISALAFVGVGAAAYFGINYFKREPTAADRNPGAILEPATPV